ALFPYTTLFRSDFGRPRKQFPKSNLLPQQQISWYVDQYKASRTSLSIRPAIRSGIPLRRNIVREKEYLHTYKRHRRNRIRFFRSVSAVILLSSEKCENTGSTSGVRCFRFISPISLKRFSLILILCRSRLWLRSTILLPLALKRSEEHTSELQSRENL